MVRRPFVPSEQEVVERDCEELSYVSSYATLTWLCARAVETKRATAARADVKCMMKGVKTVKDGTRR